VIRLFPDGPTAWPWPVRCIHWLVAASVLVNLFNETGRTHRIIGYASLALIALRLLHGMFAQESAVRFRWPGVAEIRRHFAELALRQPRSYAGHNPLGQYAVYLMWLLILLLGLTGWLSRTDALWGEEWPVTLHGLLSDSLLCMVVLHLIAVFGMSLLQRSNLIKAMLVGSSQGKP
jgi:cytochrome b